MSTSLLRPAYETARGAAYLATVEHFLVSQTAKKLRRKVNLIFTSPPFALTRKKGYGNLQGESYLAWLSDLAPKLTELLTPDGSLVLELGNAWEPGQPVMSTLPLRALLDFQRAASLTLCQQFICNNPARLPGPAQWVNIDRIRVKDSYTHVWWFARHSRPDASNRRVLKQYSTSMNKLLRTQRYNAGLRPSEHRVGARSFLTNNGGAIPSNVLTFTNTGSLGEYLSYCRQHHLPIHPARMQAEVADFFIRLTTRPRNLVLDPFAGSNTTGAAAERLKRRWIAVEMSSDYLRGSLGRFGTAIRKRKREMKPSP